MNAGNQHDHRSEQIRKLFHSYGSLMYQIAFSILKQAQNAEDTVQETLLKMIEKAEKLPFDNPDAMRAYIFVMTRNTALDLRRRMQHQISTNMNAEENQITLLPAESDDAVFEAHELAEMIRKLPKAEQQLLWMRFWERLTYKEIAAQLRISEEAANSRVRRTLAHLKKIYEGDTDAEQ